MLHDLARLYSTERLLQECRERGMSIDPFELENPIVLHARLGAELAHELFGVDDPAVLSAIRKHTLAAPDMSPLDEIVFLADGLEPERDFAERPALVSLAKRNLSKAMHEVLLSNFRYLASRGQTVSPQTLAAWETYRDVEDPVQAARTSASVCKPHETHEGDAHCLTS
jgi:predicted HD superfamily hydrolase involved in NAD metabolism